MGGTVERLSTVFPLSQPKGGARKKLYGGIDLHGHNNVVVVLDEEDQVQYQKRLPNELAKILPQLAPFRTQLQGLVVESTSYGQITHVALRYPKANVFQCG